MLIDYLIRALVRKMFDLDIKEMNKAYSIYMIL